MPKRSTTVNYGLLLGAGISLSLHGSLLRMPFFHQPARAVFERGDCAVEHTLLPAMASIATPEPAPAEEMQQPSMEEMTSAPEPVEIKTREPKPVYETEPPVQEIPEPVIPEDISSIAQDGSPEEDKGAPTDAVLQSRCFPVYPRLSRQRGEEGIVVLSVDISVAGIGSNIRVIQSSGHARLDKAAIKALQRAHFIPAMRFGKAVPSTLTQTFNFRLNDD